MEDHKPARGLLRGYYGTCCLYHSTEDDSDNLGEKGGGKRYYGTTPFELTVRVEKIKLCPVDRREERIQREEEG